MLFKPRTERKLTDAAWLSAGPLQRLLGVLDAQPFVALPDASRFSCGLLHLLPAIAIYAGVSLPLQWQVFQLG